MISVVAIFEDRAAADRLLGELASEGLNPMRTRVEGTDRGTRITLAVEEENHDAMVDRLRAAGADEVEVEMSLPPEGAKGPALFDPTPPPPV